MTDWKKYRLCDFIDFNPTISLKKGTVARKITMDRLIPHSRDIYDWVYEPYSGGAKFQNGDTIMARITPCLENGKHAYVSLLDDGETAYGSTEYIVLRGIPGISGNRFVYYLSHFPDFKNAAIKSMVGSSGRQRAQVDVLKNLEFYLPGLEEQSQIADTLSALDDKIAINNRINHNLEEQAQAIFKNWFVDFEPFKGGAFVESELGMIPDGWHIGKLDDYTSLISRGITPKYSPESNEWILGQTCVRNSIVTLNNARTHIPKSKTAKWVRQWDTLINSTGIGSLGRVGIVYFDLDNVTADSHITIVRSNNPIWGLYIGRTLLNLQDEIENMAVGSTGQTELPTDSVKNIRLIIPTEDVLTRFYALIKPIGLQIFHLLEENKKLSALRDTLLPKLMSGEIAV